MATKVSKCHGAKVVVGTDEKGFEFLKCSKCGKAGGIKDK